jgi:hypothetical protein
MDAQSRGEALLLTQPHKKELGDKFKPLSSCPPGYFLMVSQ